MDDYQLLLFDRYRVTCMEKSMDKIINIYTHLVDYLLSGVNARLVLETIYLEGIKDRKTTEDDIFLTTLFISSYNSVVLILANLIKPHSDSIHLSYLFNQIRMCKNFFDLKSYEKLDTVFLEFESDLISNLSSG